MTTATLPLKSPSKLASRRVSLGGVVRGPARLPPRVLLHAVEGLGKSTFAASAPSPIFICPEDGLPPSLSDTPRFPTPQGGWTWQDVLDAIQVLTEEPHEYRTVVLDSLDWIEPILWQHICKRDGQPNVEAYGYGKGYSAALDEWRGLIARLERLRSAKGMVVVALAHSWIKSFKDPLSEGYDRFEMKIHKGASGLWKEWVDFVLFGQHEDLVTKDARTKRVRGVSSGARIIRTTHHAAYDAKSRVTIPESLPLSWEDFMAAVAAGQSATPEAIRAEISRKASELGGDLEQTILETVKKAGDNAQALTLINNRVNARLAERTETAAQAAEEKAS